MAKITRHGGATNRPAGAVDRGAVPRTGGGQPAAPAPADSDVEPIEGSVLVDAGTGEFEHPGTGEEMTEVDGDTLAQEATDGDTEPAAPGPAGDGTVEGDHPGPATEAGEPAEPRPVERPNVRAPRGDWDLYAASHGLSADTIDGFSKADLIEALRRVDAGELTVVQGRLVETEAAGEPEASIDDAG